MSTIYSEATAEGVCWFCKGLKGWQRGDDVNGGGQFIEAHFQACGSCGGTGVPSEDQRRKAKLEQEALCTYCEFELSLHDDQHHPHGCDRAIRSIVRDQRSEIQKLKEQVARLEAAAPEKPNLIERECETCGKLMRLPPTSMTTECSRCLEGG